MAGRRKPPVIRTDSALLPVQNPKVPAPVPAPAPAPALGPGSGTTAGSAVSAGESGAGGTARINPAKSNVSVLVLAPEQADPSPTATVIEFPQPAGKRHRRRLWIALASVAAVVALVVAVVIFSPLLALKTITVDGNKLATGAAIQAALAPLKDKPLPQVDLAQVEKLLAPIPQVRSVSVEARPPSTLLVHLVEREPVALLKNDQQYIMVDPDGIQLGTTADPASVPLPIIDGGTAAIGNATFKAMTAVLAALPASILAKLAHASASSPDAVELTLDDGKTIVWGNASERELKAKVVQALVNAPPPTREAGKPEPAPVKVYDVSAPRHPVTR
jgi:cell division protein FtsQ